MAPSFERKCGNPSILKSTLYKTRMLAINVSIPNPTVARLEQFPSPQMTDNKPSFTRKPHAVIFRQSPFAANAVPKLVAMATSLSCRVSAISAFCRSTTQTPLHNQSPSRYRSHKASYSNVSPKIGCHGNVP